MDAPAATNPLLDPLEPLRDVLTQVFAANAFYQEKLAQAGCFDLPNSIEEFTRSVPFTTKADLVEDQALFPPYGTNQSFRIESYTRCHQTSGTSGKPLRWLDTPQSWSAMVEDWAEVFRQAGVHPGDRILFAFSFGPFLGFWLAFEAAQSLGCLCIPAGGMSSALRARVLVENQCTVLCCTPTYALHLAEIARQEGLQPTDSKVRLIVVAGEPGGSLPATRQRLSEAWHGARIFDHHGMTEVGPVTFEAPDSPGSLVVLERSFFAEFLHPDSPEPVPPGEISELVLTTLRRAASPLIRYRTGDLVRHSRVAGQLRLVGGILGRADDMVIVRGVNVYPSALEEIIRSIPEIAEYRVTFDSRPALPELSVEIESTPEHAQALEDQFKERLSLRIPVQAVPAGSLPRFELKAKRWQRF